MGRISRGLRRRAGRVRRRITGSRPGQALRRAAAAVREPRPPPGRLDVGQPVRLLIGPANMAGQGWLWARAVERFVPGVSAESLMAARSAPGFEFSTDTLLSGPQQRADLGRHRKRILAEATHVLFEAGRPVLGDFHLGSMLDDVPRLRAGGLAVAAVFHGSEVRDPRRHRELYPFTPFGDAGEDLTIRIQVVNDQMRDRIADFEGPCFVSTPDLIDFVPDAVWMPAVVDLAVFATDAPVFQRPRPVVLHAPSNSLLKGSVHIDPVLTELDRAKVIEYRRASGLVHAELVELIKDADIVVDQLLLGAYGVLSVEAMAAGRIAVAHVPPRVRARIPVELPLVDATPATLREVIERLVQQRDEAVKTALAGVDYARRVHDGRMAAEAIAPFLGRPVAP